MTPSTLATLELELKRAAARQRYDAVDRLAMEFGDAARSEIGSLAPGDPAVARIAQHVLDVLEWSRVITLAGRSKTADDLRSIPFLNKYLATPPEPPVVRLDV